jgi:hypothetical protein
VFDMQTWVVFLKERITRRKVPSEVALASSVSFSSRKGGSLCWQACLGCS